MSKLEAKTTVWLKEAEQKYIDGMPAVTDENRKRLMQIGLDAVQDELQRRAQKKSEAQPIEKSEQLLQSKEQFFQKQADEYREAGRNNLADKVERDVQNQHHDQAETAKAFEPQRRVIAKIENPEPLTIPVVEIEFKDREGKPYTRAVDQDDIMALLKTYFKRVACSSMMESKQYSKAYDSDMGKMVYKLFQGWNTIYSDTGEGLDWPDLKDVFPSLGRASHAQKVNAEILYRWATNQKQPS